MLKGLQYVGNANGILVMLYKSYKTVEVTWDKPYHFTKKDNISDEAKKYYQKQYKPLGIKLVEEIDADTEPAKVPEFIPEGAEVQIPREGESANIEVLTDSSAPSEVNIPSETKVDDANKEVVNTESSNSKNLDSVLSEIKSSYDRETINNLTELDLGSLLDEKLDDDQVKELATRLDYDYGRTRNKSKIVSGLVNSKLSDIINIILN